jgi:hypothetical protein
MGFMARTGTRGGLFKLLDSWRRRNLFPMSYGQTYRVGLSFKEKTGQWIMSRIAMVILICHRHRLSDHSVN